ncbi:hypothetical protein G3N58_15535 [Paraburkholderia sp. Ac-20342]|uniref:hypothetical protein n=1 Tax=Paraburkholderia sp. Ac-20342 TaxID=2703889 RepID=UPI001981C0B8|nr:hypothetical protein [Paraburkholderia sp. Ac-20342]MBN3848231.1 hypothetical protein [Paraburkholderia sp. Ac-20342]
MTDKKATLDAQTRRLAAMAYGEASPDNDADEMFGLASVLVRQRDARGYSDIGTFALSERSFSFVVSDGNLRYARLMTATEAQINKDEGMKTAIDAARNALTYGKDKSNGAYFWDGADIKSHYSTHSKVAVGIKFTDPSHNIYDIKESTKLVIKYKFTKKKVARKITIEKTELYRYDHVYNSTAAHGGTIFWKFNPDYVKFSHSKEYP